MSSGSNKLYSGSVDESVRIWDYNSGKVAWFSAPDDVSDYARITNNISDMHRLPTISLIMDE
jgi:WD40 repeat protein